MVWVKTAHFNTAMFKDLLCKGFSIQSFKPCITCWRSVCSKNESKDESKWMSNIYTIPVFNLPYKLGWLPFWIWVAIINLLSMKLVDSAWNHPSVFYKRYSFHHLHNCHIWNSVNSHIYFSQDNLKARLKKSIFQRSMKATEKPLHNEKERPVFCSPSFGHSAS